MDRRGRKATLALVACLGLSASILAQFAGLDPVERLRQSLRAPAADPAERSRILQARIAVLRTPADLRRAYFLLEWREQFSAGVAAETDGARREELAERFVQSVHQEVERADPLPAAAALDQVTEWARDAHKHGEAVPLASALTSQLVALAQDSRAPVRAAAALALGQVNPPLEVALPALVRLLASSEPPTRLAAHEALAALLEASLAPISNNKNAALQPTFRRQAAANIVSVVRLLGTGLTDWHPEIRRRCVASFGAAGGALATLIGEPVILANGAPGNDLTSVRELALVLREFAPALAGLLRDPEAEIRRAVLKTLEEIAVARVNWLKAGSTEDLLLGGLQPAVPGLCAAMRYTDVRERRAAIDVLEWLGPAGADAVPALIRALDDQDRFVRWAAVRTLNGLGPQAARPAVGRLAKLLEDPDLDIRLAVAAALERLDLPVPAPTLHTVNRMEAQTSPETRATLPNLLRSLKTADVDMRLATIKALHGLGAEARPAVPALREALRDPNEKVRVAAAELLGQLGPLARDAIDDLQVAIADRNADVRRAAGEALLAILRGN